MNSSESPGRKNPTRSPDSANTIANSPIVAHGPVTVSLGIASLPEDATTVDDLIVAADQALYDAKRLGRNRVAVQ